MSKPAKLFLIIMCALGLGASIHGVVTWDPTDLPKFSAYLLTAILASRLKIALPDITGSISVNFLFILIGVAELSFGETLLLGTAATLAQCYVGDGRWPKPQHILFNLGNSATAIWLAYFAYHGPLAKLEQNFALPLMLAACVYFVANTLPVATIICLTERKNLRKVWADCYFWSLPYYLAGGAIAGMVRWANEHLGWQATLLALPAMFVIYRSYRLYVTKLQDEKKHVSEMAQLHLRTIEALALAIEAKDQTTHDHLERVRVYAIEVGKMLHLPKNELDALRAAALLHDIGKLAVPEHIISKPGRLTPEEFEKMKIHPIVGAEILERVKFPYPVAPIVRAHHERWDGQGYPDGLAGEQIPLGARILSAVDCLDALATDRQYRKALSLDEAMRKVANESGRAYDPKVVGLLQEHYQELEQIVRSQAASLEHQKLSTDLKVQRGKAPANGFEAAREVDSGNGVAFLSSIAAARQEAQTLLELSHDLGNSLSLSEILSRLSEQLYRLVPFEAIVVYVLREQCLVPAFASGENFPLFASLRIPLNAGISGWVAHNRKPIVNGNPTMEPGYLNGPDDSPLCSALSVPLEGSRGVVGVLTLYNAVADAYTSDHLRILMAINSRVGLAVENALAFEEAENSATTDYLTGLPNARSLFMHLDRELARSRRLKTSVTVMVCDLNGFKKINDHFGHLEGNRTLKLFGQRLQESCRDYDYVARMGGDEFVIVAPGLGSAAAEGRGVRLSELARNAGQEACGVDWLSLSFGYAISSVDSMDTEQLLAEADRRMYAQKQEHHRRQESQHRYAAIASGGAAPN
ncbi:MAG TPA: HD domain-containing phosphohydrolase [Candidatus Acidoferrales bacterium]|nr:HD domain-containing phosphohydrolase [Candidatus Acidoferrales bacterium]